MKMSSRFFARNFSICPNISFNVCRPFASLYVQAKWTKQSVQRPGVEVTQLQSTRGRCLVLDGFEAHEFQ